MKICEIDRNFVVETSDGKNIKFYDSKNDIFDTYGVFYENDSYRRIPSKVKISKGVDELSCNTSGGRIRFKTNSRYVCIRCELPKYHLVNMSDIASTGFDMNIIENNAMYTKVFQMPYDYDYTGYESLVDLKNQNDKYITINFPLYNTVNKLQIGIEETAYVEKGKKYRNSKPVVFYGSSITQGALVSRPSNCYVNLLSNLMNIDVLNLGFSGSCKGELEMAKYISSLKMQCLVIDYDHNASNHEELEKTHLDFYKYIRNVDKDLPIILISKPDFNNTDEDIKRRQVILNTYNYARINDDLNVYFVDGKHLYDGYNRDLLTVDGTHPNDIGMYSIYEKIKVKLEEVLYETK